MSSETVSALFPDRPIRPLPTRRLREKLTQEAADSIEYPQPVQETKQFFCYPPCDLKESSQLNATQSTCLRGYGGQNAANNTPLASHRQSELEMNDAGKNRLHLANAARRLSPLARPARLAHTSHDGKQPLATPPSLDDYEALENNSNKKKRKIPSASDTMVNIARAISPGTGLLGTTINLNSAPATMISNGESKIKTDRSLITSPFLDGNHAMSGPGRGRLGRTKSGRSPLRTLPNGNNAWLVQENHSKGLLDTSSKTGIISKAIASAVNIAPQGQENTRGPRRYRSTESHAPTTPQFTFTCDAQVTGALHWPDERADADNKVMETRMGVAQTRCDRGMQDTHSANAAEIPRNSAVVQRRNRQRLERELDIAARHRKKAAAEDYHHNTPKLEDVWICELCEYERIFGVPPRALIREYEMKDRRNRKEEAERRRLLEKAKAKSRKGRKGSKSAKGYHNTSQSSENADDEAPDQHDKLPSIADQSRFAQYHEEGEDEDDHHNYTLRQAYQREVVQPAPESTAKT